MNFILKCWTALGALTQQVLTGSDNATLAIGRVLGVLVFLAFILVIPAFIVGAYWGQKVGPAEWRALLGTLQSYVPMLLAGVAALIAGTAFTEPKPRGDGQ